MKKIAVLMSTYNGSKYLKEQINSILKQEIDNGRYKLLLFIRDDGSSDSTKNIIANTVSKYSDMVYECDDGMGNLGVKKSFIKLVQKVNADYYFFSDQDDIWLPNKIKEMVEILKWKDCYPCGVYSDLWVADENAQSTGYLMKGKDKFTERILENNGIVDYRQLLFTYLVTGASFGFNHKFKDTYLNNTSLDDFQSIRMHDAYFALILAVEGNLYYLNKPLVLYRQHSNNLVGMTDTQKNKLLKYLKHHKDIINNRIRILQDAKLMIEKFNMKNVSELKYFIQVFSGKNYWEKWKLINKYEKYLTFSPKIIEKLIYIIFVHI